MEKTTKTKNKGAQGKDKEEVTRKGKKTLREEGKDEELTRRHSDKTMSYQNSDVLITLCLYTVDYG